MFSSVASGDTAECNDVGHCVAAEAVGTVNTACDFTGSEETRDNVALLIENLSFSVDSQTAHCVVDSRSHLNCEPGTFSQRTRHVGAAEFSVFLVSLELSVLFHCGLQVGSVDLELVGEFVKCGAFCDEALLDVCFDRFQALASG